MRQVSSQSAAVLQHSPDAQQYPPSQKFEPQSALFAQVWPSAFPQVWVVRLHLNPAPHWESDVQDVKQTSVGVPLEHDQVPVAANMLPCDAQVTEGSQ